MKVDANILFSAYARAERLVMEMPEVAADFEPVRQVFEAKRNNPDACIMVYGIYNAGKSTLINALLGREEARVEDRPTTYKVDEYTWGNFVLLDTPGVDAPVEHENIARMKMREADMVIFVVDPSGAAEEELTLQALVNLLIDGKKVFLVFNCKHVFSDDDFHHLKEKTLERIQAYAEKRSFPEVLSKIPMIKVNAKAALKAKLEGKEKLLGHSGFPQLEHELVSFLRNHDKTDAYNRIKESLVKFSCNVLEQIPVQGDAAKMDAMLSLLEKEKSQIQSWSRRRAERTADELGINLIKLLNSGNHEEVMIKRACDKAFDAYASDFKRRFEETSHAISLETGNIGVMAGSSSEFEVESGGVKVRRPDIESRSQTSDSGIDMSKMAPALSGVAVTLSKELLKFLPKAAPFVDPVLTLILSLPGLLQESPKQKEARELAKFEERRRKQIEDYSRQMADEFRRFVEVFSLEKINEYFDSLFSELSDIRSRFEKEEKSRSEQRQAWNEVKLRAEAAFSSEEDVVEGVRSA